MFQWLSLLRVWVSMVKCVVLTRTVSRNAIWIIDSLPPSGSVRVPQSLYNSVKWNVPGAMLSEIHPGGFISLIRFSLVISYANTLTVGDMGTQLGSGEIDLIKQGYLCNSILWEPRWAEDSTPNILRTGSFSSPDKVPDRCCGLLREFSNLLSPPAISDLLCRDFLI